MAAHANRFWPSHDGIELHARDYAGGTDGRPAIVCLPGLTRNARDFAALAARLSPAWRVVAADFRGRGDSGHAKDPTSYVPAVYARDTRAMLDALSIGRFVAIGTSLGGIVTMLLAPELRGRLAAAVLNDVGPDIDPRGLQRIRGYVGRSSVQPTWMHAARVLAEANADVYPHFALADWLAMAKRLYRLNSAGRIVLDYDLRIAEPFRVPGNESGPDMWSALEALAGVPVLLIRGARSDVLGSEVADRMAARLPRARLVTIPDVGHAPTLDEPDAGQAIDALLAQVAEHAGN